MWIQICNTTYVSRKCQSTHNLENRVLGTSEKHKHDYKPCISHLPTILSMLPIYQPCSGSGSHELPTHLNSGSYSLYSPPPSLSKAMQVPPASYSAACDLKKLSRSSASSIIQIQPVSSENPSVLLDAPQSSSYVSGLVDYNTTGLPSPCSSLVLPKRTHPVAFDDVVSTLKPLLEGTAGIRELSINGVTLDTIEKL